MRRLGAIAAACAIAAVAPAPAAARARGHASGSKSILIPARFSGVLTVQFHGDPAAGCARWGLCRYTGTVTWRPPPGGTVQIQVTGGRHPTTSAVLSPSFGPGPGSPGGVTTASVQMAGGSSPAPAAHCVDAVPGGAFTQFPVHRGRVTVLLARAEPPLLVTRCAGPRAPDVLPRLPAPTLSLAALERGRATVSLAASRTLGAHGLSGSISSTLALHLGSPRRVTTGGGGGLGPGPGFTRVRELDVLYHATIAGSMVEEITGAINPLLCGPLGSCGASGTITLTPRARGVRLQLIAQEPATKSRRRLLAAVGLAGGPSRGVKAIGFGAWPGGGSIRADLTQGSERCQDVARLGLGLLVVGTAGGGLKVAYGPGSDLSGGASVTHCPGPLPASGTPALARIPLSSMRGRTTRISLVTGSRTSDDGYQIRFVPHLTVTLTRVGTRVRIVRQPSGILF